MGELQDLGRLFHKKLASLIDRPMDPLARSRTDALAFEYCRQVDARWGIRLDPVIEWNLAEGRVFVDLQPASRLDLELWTRLLEKDERPYMVDLRDLPPDTGGLSSVHLRSTRIAASAQAAI